MRIFAVFILSFILLSKVFFSFGWEVYFKLNESRIAKELCENKDKPVLKCNGKCYLAKQLKKAELQEDDQKTPLPKRSVNSKISDFIDNTGLEMIIPFFLVANTATLTCYLPYKSVKYTTEIEHPPS